MPIHANVAQNGIVLRTNLQRQLPLCLVSNCASKSLPLTTGMYDKAFLWSYPQNRLRPKMEPKTMQKTAWNVMSTIVNIKNPLILTFR